MPGPRPNRNALTAAASMKKIIRAELPNVASKFQRMRKAMALSPRAQP